MSNSAQTGPGSRSRLNVDTLLRANASNKSIRLRNGVIMPLIGLGTFLAKGNEVQNAIRVALASGIRHIDTAAVYKNEADVAQALYDSGVPREEVFLTTKISPQSQGRERAEEACRRLLENLDTDYVDLVLIHWPGSAKLDPGSEKNATHRQETWEVLEDYHRRGVFRSIGVSNYEPKHLQPMVARAAANNQAVVPYVNQIEVHPRWPNRTVRDYDAQNGIVTVAYSSLGCGELMTDASVLDIAQREGVAPATLLLRWGLQKGCLVLPKSVTEERIRGGFAPDKLLPPANAAVEPTELGSLAAAEGPWPATPRLLSEEAERQLDALESHKTKFCWDPAVVF